MALTDEEELYNIALGLVGETQVTEGQTETKHYELCLRFYARSRQEVLAMHPWNEAKKPIVIPEDATAPIFNFDHRYARPSDAVLIITVNEDLLFWEDEGGWIKTDHHVSPRIYSASSVKFIAGQYVTNEDITYSVDTTFTSSDFTTDAATNMTSLGADLQVIHVEYIHDLTTISLFSPLLYDTIAHRLAQKIIVALTNDPQAKVGLTQEFEGIVLPRARTQDARQGRMRQYYNSSWLRSRSRGRIPIGNDFRS